MKLHENIKDFRDLINQTSSFLKIPAHFIEKDYWTTFILWNLANSNYADEVVFKGGTSLSKAYKCIERFSEDIDLAIKDSDIGDAKSKSIMKNVEKAVTNGLEYLENHPGTAKYGRNRKTFYEYQRIDNEPIKSFIKDKIQLEINTFTQPSPTEKKTINTFIYDFLLNNGFEDYIKEVNLQPFEVLTLSIERTFCEKLLSLIRLSYEDIEKLRSKIRHFYDITKILPLIDTGKETKKTFELALKDDKNNPTFTGIWLEIEFEKAPLFKDFKKIWKTLENQYKREMTELCWNEKMPSSSEIIKTFESIRKFVG